MSFPKTAFLLGAGLGTRLRPLTDRCPKPLLPLGGKPILCRAMDALLAFIQGARDAGFTPYIMTAYINYSSQEYIFNGRASQIAWGGTYTYEEAVEIAKTVVFYPGTSDHQTGLAVDIADRYYNSLSSANIDQDLLDWLTEHCAEYGFILRYPALKESVTGWNEPYHFRYVGTTAAEYIMERGLCLEEFIELYE